jgi:tryptophan 7-halogenase
LSGRADAGEGCAMSREVRSVVIAGAGPEAWIAAAGLLRALRHRQLAVSVVDTGPASDARIGRWTLPSQRGMHALLGIAEPHFIQHTGATYKLASEHMGWQGEGSRFLHAHGEIGKEIAGIPFYRLIQCEALAGRSERPEAYSVAGTAARLGRFARPMNPAAPMGPSMGQGNALTASFTYGFHVPEVPYTQYLRANALRLGVSAGSAPLSDVVLDESGDIQSLRLSDGTLVSGDYFIDCSGPAARLLSRIATGVREDWSAWLPCDRVWSALGPPANDPPPVTRTQAASAGWLWRAPVAQASMVGHVYSSRYQDDEAARVALETFAHELRNPVLTHFSSGRRHKSWERNCVALGTAAMELEPLAGADLHLAQIGLATFLELFPRDRASTIEAAEYNRLMAEEADALRDFTLAHYHAGASRDGDFWAAVRASAPPARLADRLDLYASIGRIILRDQETFEEVDWAWLLIGSGCMPDAIELQTREQLAKLAPREVAALRSQIQQVAGSMPRHIDFLRQVLQAARPPH